MIDGELRKILGNPQKGTIIVCLDGSINYNAISLKDFQLALKRGEELIITPLTTVIDNEYPLRGYRLIVKSEGKELNINRMLLGYDIGENDKELKIAHNTEKLILNGVYDIETNW